MLISFGFPPQGSVGVLRIHKFCKYLPDYGWSSVVLSHRLRPEFEVMDPGLLKEVPPGTRVLRPGYFDSRFAIADLRNLLRRGRTNSTSLGQAADTEQIPARATHPWIAGLRSIVLGIPDRRVGWLVPAVLAGLGEARRSDCLLATAPAFTACLVGLVLQRLTGTPLVLDFRDPWSFNPWIPQHPEWMPRIQTWLERRCVRAATVVISSTDEIRDEYVRRYPELPSGKFCVIPNGFDPCDFPDTERNAASPSPPDPMTVTYFGTLYGDRDPRPIFEALRILRDRSAPGAPGLRIRFVGSAPQDIERWAAEAGVRNMIEVIGLVPYRRAAAMMRESSVLLIVGAAETDKYCVATKTYEYIAAGRPILALVPAGPIQRLIERERVGRVAPPQDPTAIAEALLHFLERYRRQGLHGIPSERAARYNRKMLTGELAALLTRVVNQSRRHRVISRTVAVHRNVGAPGSSVDGFESCVPGRRPSEPSTVQNAFLPEGAAASCTSVP